MSGSVSVEDARSLSTGDRVTSLSEYLVSDIRGSVIATTSFDTGASVLSKETELDAWGKKLPDYSTLSSPRHGLAGAEADEAVGTYSFGARTYDPTLRRWVSPDPLLAGAPKIGEGNAETLNLYGYADGNPVKNTDTTGYCPVCAAAAGALVVIGMGLSAPSDTAQAPADIVGMAASLPGPAVVVAAAERVAVKVITVAADKGLPAAGQALRGLVQGAAVTGRAIGS